MPHQSGVTSPNAEYSTGSTGLVALITSKMANLNSSAVLTSDEEVCFSHLELAALCLWVSSGC